MAEAPGCCDSPNEIQRKILIGVNEIAEAGGGGSSGNVNLTQIAGTAASVGCGTSDVGTLRVAQATDCVVSSNISQILGAAPSATNPMPSRPTNGTAFLANLGETAATGNFVRITDGTDTALVTAAGELNVIVAGTTTLTPGTGASNLGKAEDAPHTTGDVGVMALAVANVAQTARAADGDYIPVATDLVGNVMMVGNIATDGVDAGNPVKIGAIGRTTMPTAVADLDRVNLVSSKVGELLTIHAIRELRGNQVTTITSSTTETTIITAVASTFLDLYGLLITNTSATACAVTIKDATAGTTRMIIEVPTRETRGFMLPGCDGHKQAVVNNNWTATCGTSVASIVVTALFKHTI